VSVSYDIALNGPETGRQIWSRRKPHGDRMAPLQPTQARLEVLKIDVLYDLRTTLAAWLRWLSNIRRMGLMGGGLRGIEKLLPWHSVDHRWRSIDTPMPLSGWIGSVMRATRQLIDTERGFIDGFPRGFNRSLHRVEDLLLSHPGVMSLRDEGIIRRGWTLVRARLRWRKRLHLGSQPLT
jgi:hypothetical protein